MSNTHQRNTSYKAFAENAGRACEALVAVLGRDPRVLDVYHAWFHSAPSAKLRLRDLIALVERLIRDDLRLPYPYLAQLLVTDLCAAVVGRDLRVTPGVELPGRRPKGDWRQIWRDVEWYYRAEIQVPPDSIRRLAREYGTHEGRHNDARSVVQNGIRRAKDLLSTFEAHTPLPK